MSEATVSIVNVDVVDVVSGQLIAGPVHLAGDRILSLGDESCVAPKILDGGGGTVVPGLIDAHFHAYGASHDLQALEGSPRSYIAIAGAGRLRNALFRGFTTVRDVAGGDIGLACAIAERLIASPRYLYTGPALSQTGGHGDPRPSAWEWCGCGSHIAEIVDGVDALRKAVRERFRQGAHAIKVMTSGGVVSPTDPIRVPQYSPEEIRAVVDEAARRGSYVAAHAYSAEAVLHAVENGVRSVEHGNLLDKQAADVMAEHEAFLVPTLAAYDAMDRRGDAIGLSPEAQMKNQQVLEAGQEAIVLAKSAGVKIGFGTDLMGSLEDDQLEGLRLQADVMGPLELLRSATVVNARLLGLDDIGKVVPGAAADLLVLTGNPLEDPSLLWKQDMHHAVVQRGVVL